MAVLSGAFLAITGAFGSGGAPLLQRLTYWVLVMVIGGLWGHVCGLAVGRFVDADERPWLAVAALTAVITGPLSVVVWAATGLFFAHRLYSVAALPQLFVPVLIVTAAITTVNVFLGRAAPVQTHADPVHPGPARFLQRLPVRLRGATLYAVQAEDHYLRIHTDRGSDLILMRLSDALDELEGLEGAQTHRSWWVARAGIERIERQGREARIRLVTGEDVPVARDAMPRLRAAGWL